MIVHTPREQADVLRAVVGLAVADRYIAPSEGGLLTTLASRFGVTQATLDRLIEQARSDPDFQAGALQCAHGNPESTLELLVAAARLDGEVADEERMLLERFGRQLDVSAERFSRIYLRGVKRADELRRQRFGG